ncbi:MAG: hypothetical protein ACNA77_05905 [Opitutales bacterium]
MQVHARISKEWRRRMLFMFAMLFGFACWFLTDGYIIWPNEGERYEAYAEIRDKMLESGEAEDEESLELRVAWQKYTREADISAKVPKQRTPDAIQEQRSIGWFLMAVSLTFGAWVAWNHRLSIRAEGETIIGASGQRVELDSIIATDRKKWKNKGIAYAIYEENGKKKRLCLDDHKFAGAEAILLEAERRIKARAEKSADQETDEA